MFYMTYSYIIVIWWYIWKDKKSYRYLIIYIVWIWNVWFPIPKFFTHPAHALLYFTCVFVCIVGWPTNENPSESPSSKLAFGVCFYPLTLETCCKYNHIIISAKFWSNSNNSFLIMYKKNSSFQGYYVWFSCFPNTSGWFQAPWVHSWEVSFKPLEPTNFPGVEEIPGSRSNLRSTVGFSPPQMFGSREH